MNVFYALTRSLQRVETSLPALRVLDLGCGTGRSARMYIDMGLRPDQVIGLDFRPGAIALARKLNPSIRAEVYDGGDLPSGSNWISMVTVLSSVATRENREEVVSKIRHALPAGGYVFYYDLRNANAFAGGDRIEPENLFSGFRVVWRQRLGRFSGLPNRDRLQRLAATRLLGDDRTPSLKDLLSDILAPSHEALLLQKT